MIRPFIFAISSVLLASSARAQQTQFVDVQTPTHAWSGWNSGLIDEDPSYRPSTQPTTAPSQSPAYPTPAGLRQTFSGKVVGLGSFESVEVALVPALKREYLTHSYQVAMVRDDGTFDLFVQQPIDQPTTLCVRVPGHPWTFAPWDFPPGSSARDVVLRPEEGKRMSVTAALRDKPMGKGWISVDAFDGYQRHDASGQPLQSQYYGGHQSDDGTTSIVLPLRPMALRVRADGSAAAFVMIDPRQTDRLVVTLPPEAKLVARVVNGQRIIGGKTVALFNPCERLSFSALDTGTDGKIELDGLMPGDWVCVVDGHEFVLTLEAGRTTETKFDLSLPPQRPRRPGQASIGERQPMISIAGEVDSPVRF